jgi:hypothetical protein
MAKTSPPRRRSKIFRDQREVTKLSNPTLMAPRERVNGDLWVEAANGTAHLKVQVGDVEVTLVSKAY